MSLNDLDLSLDGNPFAHLGSAFACAILGAATYFDSCLNQQGRSQHAHCNPSALFAAIWSTVLYRVALR